MPAFFSNRQHTFEMRFWHRQQLLLRFIFYLLNRGKTLFHWCLQFWEEEKIQLGISPMKKVVKACLRLGFCELVRYHGVNSMTGFSTILCLANELLCAINT